MIIKLSRESILVTISALMALIGLFYYGNELLINPLEERADAINTSFEHQQALIEEYPPSEELLSEYESKYTEAQAFIPLNVQANQALINLETLASKAKVSVLSLSRVVEQEPLGESENFAKDTYSAQLTANTPTDLRKLIDLLMEQERVWNVSSFSYSKSGDENYTASLNLELYYRLQNNG